MSPDKAIKALERYFFTKPSEKLGELDEAARLGLEALKRLKEQRSRTTLDEYDFLPGETKD